ncbi:MAG: 16S rRNA (adenine(1518)-N(6)/adenine(1519)-N(6))-dimethyltransferase RsmA [Ruminococcus sp.]|nr:16S rRNA (adenine(1518)-N(6)/adenine(1519)-N(6))-dimethyltransferase RsmA [Ruminococcus sp.]
MRALTASAGSDIIRPEHRQERAVSVTDKLSNIGVIKEILSRHGFSFSKSLGQNFLVNPSVCPRIAELGNAKPGFGIIEIGTGIGVLTNELAKRADKVVAVEIDERLMPVLAETLSEHDNVKIVNADIMEVDLAELIKNEFGGLEVAVCANLPYYITSPVIMRLLEERLPIRSITVMVQKEAGVRLCAPMPSRDMGAVTAAVHYFSEPELLFNVSRGSFMPPPNVDSCVVRFNIREKTPEGVRDEAFFFRTVRAAFSQRRKTLANSAASGLSADKAVVSAAIEKAGLPAAVRPEQLTMEQFIAFANELGEMLGEG